MSIVAGLEHIVRENEPLAPYTQLQIGGNAQFFSEPTCEAELVELVQRFTAQKLPIRLIGEGSNILVRDEGVTGLVVLLSAPDFRRISVLDNQMTCAGGTKLSHFVSTAVREGFAGPENLVGLPGTIGGALHVNTGTHAFDIGSCVQSANVLTRKGEVIRRDQDSMAFSWRRSSLDELAVLEATFQFEHEDPAVLTRRMQKLWIVRRASHAITESAVYVFRDPGSELASDLIAQCGLKGTRIGNVEISDSDPNTFVADKNASSSDFIELIQLVQDRVADRLEIKLEPALEIW